MRLKSYPSGFRNAVSTIRSHNETLSVAAMCVQLKIVRPLESIAAATPTPSGFAEDIESGQT
jgi:hypothetical protein